MTTRYRNLPNLASERFGAAAIACNDEFFAPMANLVSDAAPVFEPDRYTDRGKWMDGWETRRRREPGHDWCVLRLGLPGVIREVVVDTAHFTGNYPEAASVEAGDFASDDEAQAAGPSEWALVVAKAPLEGGAANRFEAAAAPRATHVRLNVFPDGGVARLRVRGEVVPDWAGLAGREVDLAAVAHGGEVTGCSDWYFCEPANLLLPGPPRTMGDGWETRRRRGPGNDWVELRLGVAGHLRRLVVDTARFKGNAPGWVSIAGRSGGDDDWHELVPRTAVQPDTANEFTDVAAGGPVEEMRLDIYPDGGVARLRALGVPADTALAEAGTARLNVLARRRAHRELLRCCGSARWAEQVAGARPYQDFDELLTTAEQIWWDLDPDDWMEAFRAHPRIGERTGAAWSQDEQGGMERAAAGVEARLREANDRYERTFGHIFIVFATGKSPEEMLELLEQRLGNESQEEFETAAAEQAKITRLRLHKLMGVTPAAIRAGRP